ncbi:MAG: hypothetical protein GY744_10275 [Gammaproteobacteria bacterium]|nr:hypothetical protein [Gammaproteobacteria bacterium]
MSNKIDIQFLKRTLIFFSISLLLSAGLIFAGYQYESKKIAEHNKVKASLSAAHSRYIKLVEDIDLIHLYTERYKEYRKSGLIGPERRLSWIESLELVNEALQLPQLSYTLAPQQEYAIPKFKTAKKIYVSSTPMELNMHLLHEEDIFAVFEGIENSIDNLFTIDSCSIKRKRQGNNVLSTKDSNLISSCLLRWITVDVQNK